MPVQTLRLLSFNIQVGINSQHYRHYITKLWQHVLPVQKRQENLEDISHIIKDYDVVALQEVDGGSLRSSFINQVEFLGERSHFHSWSQQCNRNLGKFAQHSNGILPRAKIFRVINHRLPGRIPGRGAIEALLGVKDHQLAIIVVHLSLGKQARNQQLEYLSGITKTHPHCIIMGDWNTSASNLEDWAESNNFAIAGLNLNLKTYPSWRPKAHIDHILVSKTLQIKSTETLDVHISDHLPLAVTIELPDDINFSTQQPNNKPH